MSRKAVVIGGSIAGLMAAKVLSKHFEQVIMLERDQYPDEPVFRSGTPQARHGHILLGAGQKAMDHYFPELRGDLAAAGIGVTAWGKETPLLTAGGWLRRSDADIETVTCSRLWLEWATRRRLMQTPNIEVLSDTLCTGLLANSDHSVVTGVQIQRKGSGTNTDLLADLVVDASGRSSKTPEWLTELGYQAPHAEVVNAHLGYATRWYEEPEQFRNVDWKTIAIHPRPMEKNYRAGFILRVEKNLWTVILIGANKDYPPTEEAAFLEFARSLSSSEVYDFIRDAKPTTPIYGYRHTENRLYHYEKLQRRPENLIVMGDAVCGFNPMYGQGMSVIGLESLMLDEMLAKQGIAPGFADAFQKKLYHTLKDAWLMATGNDLTYPDTEGERPGLIERLIQKYISLLIEVMPHDDEMSSTFVRVVNMIETPPALLNPRFMWKLLKFKLFRPAQPPSPVTTPESQPAISVAKREHAEQVTTPA